MPSTMPPPQVSARTVVLAGLALGAVIALARGMGSDDDDTRRTEELALLRPQPADDKPAAAPIGNGAHEEDVSQLARRLADTTSEVDAR